LQFRAVEARFCRIRVVPSRSFTVKAPFPQRIRAEDGHEYTYRPNEECVEKSENDQRLHVAKAFNNYHPAQVELSPERDLFHTRNASVVSIGLRALEVKVQPHLFRFSAGFQDHPEKMAPIELRRALRA
jgi:hypothetical protein